MHAQINLMYTQRKYGPLVWVKKGCLSNLPEGCKALNIGMWNTRTLLHVFKLENLPTEMIRLKIYILGVSGEIPEAFE